MLLMRIFYTFLLFFSINAAYANNQTIVVPLIKGCDEILNDQYIRHSLTAEPVIHRFDIHPEMFVYQINGYAQLQVPDIRANIVKDQLSSLYSLCVGTTSRAILSRDNGLVPTNLMDELRLYEKYGDGKLVVIVEEEKDIEILRVSP